MDSGTIKVVVKPPDSDVTDIFSPANAPALSGDYLAYEDAEGIKVVDWRNDTPVQELDGPYSRPALAWPLLAYIRDDGAYERLILADLSNPGNPTERRITSVRSAADLGRPALRGGRLAWHRIVRGGSSINVLNLATDELRVIKRTHVWMESNPSVTSQRIIWVEHRPQGSYLRMRWFGSKRTKTLAHLNGRQTFLWTTALTGRTAYVTKWTPSTRKSLVLRVNF